MEAQMFSSKVKWRKFLNILSSVDWNHWASYSARTNAGWWMEHAAKSYLSGLGLGCASFSKLQRASHYPSMLQRMAYRIKSLDVLLLLVCQLTQNWEVCMSIKRNTRRILVSTLNLFWSSNNFSIRNFLNHDHILEMFS